MNDPAPHQPLGSWVLVLYLTFILSASLFPFALDLKRALEAFETGFAASLTWRTPTPFDLLTNVFAYVPAGFLIALRLPAALLKPARIGMATLLGALLSMFIELLQHAFRLRVPSIADFGCNSGGALAGALLAAGYSSRRWRLLTILLRRAYRDPVPPLLAAVWWIAHAAPFVPRRPTLENLQYAVAPLLQFEVTAAGTLRQGCAALILAALVRALARRERFWLVLLATIVSAWCASVVFRGHRLHPDELLGVLGAVAITAWLRRLRHLEAQRPAFVLACAGLLLIGLAPWAISETRNAWQLAPFVGTGVLTDGGFAHALERVFLIAGVVWLGATPSFGPLSSAAVVGAIVLLVECAQMFIATRVPDTSDLVLAACGAALAWITLRTGQRVDARRRPG